MAICLRFDRHCVLRPAAETIESVGSSNPSSNASAASTTINSTMVSARWAGDALISPMLPAM